jgi:hypothetical protein
MFRRPTGVTETFSKLSPRALKKLKANIVSVDGEIGGYDGEARAWLDFGLEKIRDNTPLVVVPDP